MKLGRAFASALLIGASWTPGVSGAVTIVNLARGVDAPVTSNVSWSNYSVLNLIPGSAVFPTTSATTAFYLGFTAGTTAQISNIVVYTTPRGSLKISAVTPVTYGGTSSPSIKLGTAAVCPVAPATATPCIVRFDPTTLSLSPASDYYLVAFFTNATNNASVGAAQSGAGQSSFVGTYTSGVDYTHLKVGASIPIVLNGTVDFLMYVMND